MDEEAKVCAHGVFDVGASIDEALEAVAPRLVFGGYLSFMERVVIMVMVGKLILDEISSRVVRQEHTDNTVASLTEGSKITGTVEVFTHKFRASL
jgi:hypothetical protein